MTIAPPRSGGGYELPRYPFRRPPELDGADGRHPVVVVGAGLTGLTIAADLGLRGVPVVVVDEDDTVGARGASSRGICYAQKTLEVLDRIGVAERIREKGTTWSVGRTLSGQDEVYSFDLAVDSRSTFPPFVNIQQFYVEAYLVERISELPSVDLRWLSRLTAVHQDTDRVHLTVQTPDGEYTLHADWVVDATGSGSPIRDALGLDPHADRAPDRWCISDIRFPDDRKPERYTWVDAPFNGDRAVWLHLMADDVWRVDFQMPSDCDPSEVSRREVVDERLRAMLGDDLDYEVVWIGPYQYRSALVDLMRVDRIFLVGDSAHVVSPFGARGGNSGVQDAENLAWKLHLVLSGQADPALLDSYHDERHAAARTNLVVTRRTARFLAPRSHAERTLRRAVLDLARHHPFARPLVNTGRMSVPVPYGPSRFIAPGAGTPVQSSTVSRPEGWTGSLGRLGSQRPGRFLALVFPGEGGGPDPEGLSALVADLPVDVEVVGRTLLDHEAALADQLGARPGDVWLLRPDLFTVARCRDGEGLRTALLAALGRPAGASPQPVPSPAAAGGLPASRTPELAP